MQSLSVQNGEMTSLTSIYRCG